jgi:ATP-binding cassette subfamily E protein 1
MATYLSDRVIVYEGTPSVEAFAGAYVLVPPSRVCRTDWALRCSPESLLTGMNKFLASLEITFRRDVRTFLLSSAAAGTDRQWYSQPTNFRPRINKLNSLLDKEQKLSNQYFFTDGMI